MKQRPQPPPNERKLRDISKRLSWLLRHGALESDLDMDAAGWSRLDDVLAMLRIRRDLLDAVVAGNNKSRFTVDDDGKRIRAVQGHSTEGTPVTADALEASWTKVQPDDVLIHGTRLDVLQPILDDGLTPQARTHVHLAASSTSTVGKRANVQLHVHVCPQRLQGAGIGVFEADNGVLLVRHVPPSCITQVHAQSAKTKRALAEAPWPAVLADKGVLLVD